MIRLIVNEIFVHIYLVKKEKIFLLISLTKENSRRWDFFLIIRGT